MIRFVKIFLFPPTGSLIGFLMRLVQSDSVGERSTLNYDTNANTVG